MAPIANASITAINSDHSGRPPLGNRLKSPPVYWQVWERHHLLVITNGKEVTDGNQIHFIKLLRKKMPDEQQAQGARHDIRNQHHKTFFCKQPRACRYIH